jgi:hypothetical protein
MILTRIADIEFLERQRACPGGARDVQFGAHSEEGRR